MKAHELAALLLDGPDEEVHLSYDYGDRNRTTCCVNVTQTQSLVIKPWPYGGDDKSHVIEDDDHPNGYEDMDEWEEWNDDEAPEGAHVAVVLG